MKAEKSYMLDERKDHILIKKSGSDGIKCDQDSVSGAVSQRACVYCGARVVLNPITDAVHIVHGPIGCASYTWDIRGSLSSGSENFRNSFSTDLQEKDIIFGGEKKLASAIEEIVEKIKPQIIFVYSTCVVGVIGDDLEAVCKEVEKKFTIKVIPVQSSGFAGSKKDGYKAACNAIISLMDSDSQMDDIKDKRSFNYLGEFNLAGEIWILGRYFNALGLKLITGMTGDSSTDKLKEAKNASFNIVQCAGSSIYLAEQMKVKYGIDYERVSFFGIDDTSESLRTLAKLSKDEGVVQKAEAFIELMIEETEEALENYKNRCRGKKVAIYVGGGFKAISLIKQFNELGMETVMVGTQTGRKEEYEKIKELSNEGTVILDDTNPSELESFMKEKGADLLVGGVKERPLAYKLGIAFIDHNHERKHPLCGYEGAVNFAKEVDLTVNSPVWNLVKGGGLDEN
ncbi:nitrogenase iron-molybdenum cofactor biosynthesis protein NifE [Alkalibacter saccharofermentans]|uniref:Nitrogenase iron-molybdenum cofactor biosynthesis protein NifE n=1 Tax=Alkalibacter saccharofermentans DSM 14828 TaxID=1120975 RepID=A0A1M4S4E8_9FIRM|nr:nitrogenase iron-molybdenum cofactor biosynthesis protein NifE [Alkalibacter saccharofermentans]SHE27010.1 nitrogenase molybdenum-cofactor synthesis protein NifE [Alkalibacter saccharofermentans DSM 14828]